MSSKGTLTLFFSGISLLGLSFAGIICYLITKSAYRGTIDCETARLIDSNTITIEIFASLVLVSSLIGLIIRVFRKYTGWWSHLIFLFLMVVLFAAGSVNNGWVKIGEPGGDYCVLQSVGTVTNVETNEGGAGYNTDKTYPVSGQGRGLRIKLNQIGANGSLPDSADNYRIVDGGIEYTLDEIAMFPKEGDNEQGSIKITGVTGG